MKTTQDPAWIRDLIALRACQEAVDWCRTQPDADTAWTKCERGDWMLWMAGRGSGKSGGRARRRLTLAACECARVRLPDVPDGEERPRVCIETAEAWARGEGPTLNDVRADAYAAAAAYSAA